MPANDDLAVRLQRQGDNRFVRPGAGVKRGVERAVGVQARHAHAGDAVNARELSADDDHAVGLKRENLNRGAQSAAGVKRGVQRAVDIESRNVTARRAVDGEELPADENFAVRLEGQGDHQIIHAWVEGGVQRSVRVQTHNGVARHVIEQIKITCHDRLAVGLQRHGCDRCVLVQVRIKRPAARVKGGIQRGVGIKPGNAVATRATTATCLGEKPAHQQLAIGLHPSGKDIAVKTGLERLVHTTDLGQGRGNEAGQDPENHHPTAAGPDELVHAE